MGGRPHVTDQLTGLANRSYLIERLRGLDSSTTVAVCFVDLDDFNSVNDIYGHRIGDAVLELAAKRIAGLADMGDILARSGGDEFVVVHRDNHRARSVADFAERVREVLAQPFEVCDNSIRLTASIGICVEDRIDTPDALLRRAALALNAAKDNGSNRVEVYDAELAHVASERRRQQLLVGETLDQDKLQVFFQPIVDQNDAVVGLEALSRCLDADGTIVEPRNFLKAVDGTSDMVRLDHQAFALGCATAARLANEDLWVSCNFSAITLSQSGLAERVLSTIDSFELQPRQICIEITENSAFEVGHHAMQELATVADAGVRVALDDFGTGYSSLSHLRDLPLSAVKIDRSFTEALASEGTSRVIATAVGEMADALDLLVVLEGVETASQAEAARSLGLCTMQGWLISEAMPIDELVLSHVGQQISLKTELPA